MMTEAFRAGLLKGISLGLDAAADQCSHYSTMEYTAHRYIESDTLHSAALDIRGIAPDTVVEDYANQLEDEHLTRIMREASDNVASWPLWKKARMRELIASDLP